MSGRKKRAVPLEEPEIPCAKKAKKAKKGEKSKNKPSTSKASSSKESDIFDRDEQIVVTDLDPALVNSKYNEAIRKPNSDVLCFHMITLSGKFCGSQRDMQDLIKAHGGKIGSKAVFNLLIASADQYNMESAKVLKAECEKVPIVHEIYLYETIIKGRKPNIGKYSFENVDLEALGPGD